MSANLSKYYGLLGIISQMFECIRHVMGRLIIPEKITNPFLWNHHYSFEFNFIYWSYDCLWLNFEFETMFFMLYMLEVYGSKRSKTKLLPNLIINLILET